MYLSSLSASYSAPWPLLGAYAVSKAALDKLVEAWRIVDELVTQKYKLDDINEAMKDLREGKNIRGVIAFE